MKVWVLWGPLRSEPRFQALLRRIRCRGEEALAALNRAVLEVLPSGPRGTGLTLTTDNGTQFTSARYVETLNRLNITHRRTVYTH